MLIRAVFCNGVTAAFASSLKEGGKLSELLSAEEKQIIVDVTELLFGTEGFRAPSTIIETNMMLDLIIKYPNEWDFTKAFSGKFIPRKLEAATKKKAKDVIKHLTDDPNGKNPIQIEELINPETGKIFSNWAEKFDQGSDVLAISFEQKQKYFHAPIDAKTLGTLKSVADIENGGELSYTMKSIEGHSGGIVCGRKFSQKLNEALEDEAVRVHKYGGPFGVRKDDFTEYCQRKKHIETSWVERISKFQIDSPAITKEWYGR